MKYTILEAISISRLMEQVAGAIEKGWVPQGGVAVNSVSPVRNDVTYYQAMVKISGT